MNRARALALAISVLSFSAATTASQSGPAFSEAQGPWVDQRLPRSAPDAMMTEAWDNTLAGVYELALSNDPMLAMAEAEAKAMLDRAEAQKAKLMAEAEGRAAVIEAENAQSNELMAMKLDEERIRTLPEVVERMLKPAEKIESIRINHITGMGHSGGSSGEGGGGDASTVNQLVDGVLSMALQLPAVQRLGEEVGMNIGDGVRGITSQLDHRSSGSTRATKTDGKTSDTKG